MNKNMIVLLALALSGCATITEGTTQPIAVSTAPEQGAECTLMNGVGSWKITTPGNIQVHKSVTSLQVKCTKAGYSDGGTVLLPKINADAQRGNVLLGGLIGTVIDGSTGASHEYPPAVVVTLEKAK